MPKATTEERLNCNRQLVEILKGLVEACPDQRFGQIITNYIFPDYREQDPFYEESKETLRVVGQTLQDIANQKEAY